MEEIFYSEGSEVLEYVAACFQGGKVKAEMIEMASVILLAGMRNYVGLILTRDIKY